LGIAYAFTILRRLRPVGCRRTGTWIEWLYFAIDRGWFCPGAGAALRTLPHGSDLPLASGILL